MPSLYSNSLRVELIATGEQAGIWGVTNNRNLGTLLEQAIAGYKVVALPNTNYTLTTANGLEDEARTAALEFTGTLTATRVVTVPSATKQYFFKNSTNQSLTFQPPVGTGYTLPAGQQVTLVVTGGAVVQSVTHLNTLSVGTFTGTSATLGTAVITTATITTATVTTLNVTTATAATGTVGVLNNTTLTVTGSATVPTPTAATHAATRGYTDSLVASATLFGAKPYASFSAAQADIGSLAANQIVLVINDETKSGFPTYYQKVGTAYTFLRFLERYDSAVSYLPDDTVQNYITRLLVATGRIPQVKAGITSNFVTESYTLG